MDKLKMDATTEELIAEMQEVLDQQETEKDDDPGLSSAEWATVWEISIKGAHKRLQKLHRLGKLANGRAYSPAIDGRILSRPVYRIAE